MGRLIEADKLIEAIRKSTCQWPEHLWKLVVCDVINNQPTAYDVEKVVEKLDEFYELVEDNQKLVVRHATDIVKHGGVE